MKIARRSRWLNREDIGSNFARFWVFQFQRHAGSTAPQSERFSGTRCNNIADTRRTIPGRVHPRCITRQFLSKSIGAFTLSQCRNAHCLVRGHTTHAAPTQLQRRTKSFEEYHSHFLIHFPGFVVFDLEFSFRFTLCCLLQCLLQEFQVAHCSWVLEPENPNNQEISTMKGAHSCYHCRRASYRTKTIFPKNLVCQAFFPMIS